MAFSEEDKILIKVLRKEKGYGAKRLLNEFSNKSWCLSYLKKLLKKIDETDTVDRKPGSGKKRTTRQTIALLSRETPDFISPLLWPPNSSDLNPVDYQVWSVGLLEDAFIAPVFVTSIT